MRQFRKAQVTVLVLLLGLLALTVGMSAVSRSVSDLKQVSRVDLGTKTLFAAEAGLEYALALPDLNIAVANSCPSGVPGWQTISGVTVDGVSTIQYYVCKPVVSGLLELGNLQAEQVYQVDTSSLGSNNDQMFVFWKSPNGATGVGLEIMQINGDSSILRYIYDPDATRVLSNKFSSPTGLSSCPSSCGAASVPTGYTHCSKPISLLNGNGKNAFLRIKPLYAASYVAVCDTSSGNSNIGIPNASYTVVARATGVDGTVKIVQATRTPAFLPGIFDNVLYSGGILTK